MAPSIILINNNKYKRNKNSILPRSKSNFFLCNHNKQNLPYKKTKHTIVTSLKFDTSFRKCSSKIINDSVKRYITESTVAKNNKKKFDLSKNMVLNNIPIKNPLLDDHQELMTETCSPKGKFEGKSLFKSIKLQKSKNHIRGCFMHNKKSSQISWSPSRFHIKPKTKDFVVLNITTLNNTDTPFVLQNEIIKEKNLEYLKRMKTSSTSSSSISEIKKKSCYSKMVKN